jgi:MFS family permease
MSSLMMSAAVSILYRYADFVAMLGGTEFHLGWIVGIGMVGSLAMRTVLGTWIDRYGAGLLWVGSILLFTAACFAHLAVASRSGVAIYALRIAYCCAVAGFQGASVTFVSSRAANDRVAELVGMLGAGSFTGAVIGTVLGDCLFGSLTITFVQVAWMFVAAGLLGLLALPFAWAAGRSEKASRSAASPSPKERIVPFPLLNDHETAEAEPSSLALVLRYHPGVILAVAVAMGVGLGLPATFLRTYATELGVPRIGLFFLVYSIAAIVIRVPTRRWTERFGPRRIIIAGMAIMTASIAAFLLVHAEWQLVIPAVGFGTSHGILWPAVVAAGSATFPRRHRGLATVLILAAWDLGLLVASPAVGVVLNYSRVFDLPAYPTMFLSVAVFLAAIGLWYAVASRKAESG